MTKYKIAEIFTSIQGEGLYTGTPVTFLRFAGCNLKCPWCDTDHSVKLELTAEEIREELERLYRLSGIRRVVCTGGEPLLQMDITLLKKMSGFHIHVETNGTILPKFPMYMVEHWTVSPKKGSPWKLKEGNELKIVYEGQKNLETVRHANRRSVAPDRGEDSYDRGFLLFYLQPKFGSDMSSSICNKEETDKNIKEVVNLLTTELPLWKLSLQTHKLIGIR